jgi:protein-tyrosine phosphatase
MPLNTLNFRDLGGIEAGSGRVRDGMLYRSEGPANFGADQITALRQLDIRSIVDLRSARERGTAPHDWQDSVCRWLQLDVNADLRVFGEDGRERLSRGTDTAIAIDTMVDTYLEIPGAMLPHWPVIGDALHSGSGAVMVCCTAGKDRTGVAIAVLLELAGVPRDAIMRDYLRSSIFGENIKGRGTLEADLMASYGFLPSQEQIDALIGVRPEYLQAAWDLIDKNWSGTTGYLAAAGIDEARQSAIAGQLLAATDD